TRDLAGDGIDCPPGFLSRLENVDQPCEVTKVYAQAAIGDGPRSVEHRDRRLAAGHRSRPGHPFTVPVHVDRYSVVTQSRGGLPSRYQALFALKEWGHLSSGNHLKLLRNNLESPSLGLLTIASKACEQVTGLDVQKLCDRKCRDEIENLA